MANQDVKLQIVVNAKDEASRTMRQLSQETENLEKKTDGYKNALQGAMGIVSAYAGMQGLGQLINASEDSSRELAQARFFLAGYGHDIDKNFAILKEWGSQQQRVIGIGDEYATLVASKLLPRVKNMNKAQEYANILLRGQRLGMLNAQEAANMMIRATEGNERALRFLLEQFGIAAPEFVSMQTLFEELARHVSEGEKEMSPFSLQWARLKESIGDFMENAGAPLVAWLGTAIGWVNQLLEKFPWLSKVISGAMLAIAAVLAIAGIAATAQFIAPLLSGIGALGAAIIPFLLNPWTLVILALIALGIWLYTHWSTVSAVVMGIWNGMKQVWTSVIDYISDKMLAFYNGSVAIWNGFKQFWIDLWQAIKDTISGAFSYISNLVNQAIQMVNNAISAVSNLANRVGSSISSAISGRRASGGSVSQGSSYLVGENGPEVFMPMAGGTIIPNGASVGGGGSIAIDMSGGVFLDRTVAVQIGDMIVRRLREIHRISST
jgi:hypothetical protein